MHFIIFLFIIELFFGFNGKWLVLGGVSARHWLFAIMLFMVYGKAVYYFWKNWKFEKELSFLGFLCKELRTFKFFDRFLAVFVASHIIWIVVIPYMQQKTNPGGLGLGILSFTLLVDSVVFRGMNITRMLATFEVSQDTLEKGEAQSLTWENTEYSVENERRGTANSNTTRILLIRSLWKKIKERPILGHGFTLPLCDMQGLNYIAKVGLVGV